MQKSDKLSKRSVSNSKSSRSSKSSSDSLKNTKHEEEKEIKAQAEREILFKLGRVEEWLMSKKQILIMKNDHVCEFFRTFEHVELFLELVLDPMLHLCHANWNKKFKKTLTSDDVIEKFS